MLLLSNISVANRKMSVFFRKFAH